MHREGDPPTGPQITSILSAVEAHAQFERDHRVENGEPNHEED